MVKIGKTYFIDTLNDVYNVEEDVTVELNDGTVYAGKISAINDNGFTILLSSGTTKVIDIENVKSVIGSVKTKSMPELELPINNYTYQKLKREYNWEVGNIRIIKEMKMPKVLEESAILEIQSRINTIKHRMHRYIDDL